MIAVDPATIDPEEPAKVRLEINAALEPLGLVVLGIDGHKLMLEATSDDVYALSDQELGAKLSAALSGFKGRRTFDDVDSFSIA